MRLLTTAAVLLLAAAAAAAGDGFARVSPGDAARGDLAPGETDRVEFDGVEGMRFSADLRAGFEPEMVLRGPDGLEVDASERTRESRRRVRLLRLPLPASGKYTLELRPHSGGGGDEEGGSYVLATAVRRSWAVRASGSGTPGAETAIPLGDLPGGATLRLRLRGGTLAGLSGPGGAVQVGGGRTGSAVLPSTGAWSVSVVPDADRPVRVTAVVRLPSSAAAERDVLDSVPPGPAPSPADVVGRVVLVRMREGSDEAEFEGRHGCDAQDEVAGTGFVRVAVPDGVEVEAFLDEIALDGDVVEGEPILLSESPEGDQSNVPFTASDASQADVSGQEAFAVAGVLQAQGIADGAGVVVAVLDTGVLTDHPDLAGHLLPGYDFVENDADPLDAPNGIDDDGDGLVDEGVGHGTFVAGLVASIAPGAQVLPLRVLDSDARGTSEGVARAIVHAVENVGKTDGHVLRIELKF